MVFAYLLTIPAIVGGLAAYLKLRNPWARAAGMLLLTLGLFGLLLMPALWQTPPSR